MSVPAKICCFAAGVSITTVYAHSVKMTEEPLVLQSAQTAAFDDPPALASVAAGSDRPVARSDDGMFYANALVNGRKLRFLIDTGASTVVLTKRDAEKIGLDPAALRGGAMVRTAGGRRSMTWTRLDRVEVGSKHIRKVRAVVVQSGLEVSLLGQNALAALGGLSIKNDELSFR